MANTSLKMVSCGRCKAKVFIPGNLGQFETTPCPRCEHPVMLPVQMRQFELRTVIASGGMGTVYTAFDTGLERAVALKMMKREMAQDPEVMSSFYREARAGASLNHTNIIHIYTFDEYEGQPYLVMELADQGSLDSRIETEQRLPELDVLDVGIKIGSALATAQKHNLLHRDIKPSNILYNIDKEPKLVDFGLAGQAEADMSEQSSVWGTPEYVAPEKIKREAETYLSDMYSLGGTLYHALTGHVPFLAPTVDEMVMAHVNVPLTSPYEIVSEITAATNDAICMMLAKSPAERFQTYDELIMALEISRSQLLVQKFQTEETGGGSGRRNWWRK